MQRPGLPIFTLRLGAVGGVRPALQEVAGVITASAPSCSLAPSEGFLLGRANPGWAVTIASHDLERIATLAEVLRARFQQEGVGIEAYGRYLQAHAGQTPGELLAELLALAHGFHPAYFRTLFLAESIPPVWPAAFGIVTAWATTGEQWSAAQNQEADDQLRRVIQTRGLPHQRLTGISPDGKHAEPGWALTAARADVVALGRDFLQDAVYWVESDQLQVLSCREDRSAMVGRFAERVRAAAE